MQLPLITSPTRNPNDSLLVANLERLKLKYLSTLHNLEKCIWWSRWWDSSQCPWFTTRYPSLRHLFPEAREGQSKKLWERIMCTGALPYIEAPPPPHAKGMGLGLPKVITCNPGVDCQILAAIRNRKLISDPRATGTNGWTQYRNNHSYCIFFLTTNCCQRFPITSKPKRAGPTGISARPQNQKFFITL